MRTEVYERSRSRVTSLLQMAKGLPAGRPLAMAHYVRPQVVAGVADVIRRAQPDVVVASELGGAALVTGLINADRVVLDLHDAEHLRFAMLAAAGRGINQFVWLADSVLIRRWMQRHLGEYGAVAMASTVDLEACRAIAPRAAYVVAENGVDLAVLPRSDPGGASLLMLGDLRYPPNQDALSWFSAEVLPLCPSVRAVRVVGGGPVPRPVDSRIVPVGFVPSVSAEFARATALVAPIRVGAGTRLKILEAFAAGVPVVSTTVGAEGLDAVDGQHLLIADDAYGLASSIERVVNEPELRARLAQGGRALVESRFGWSRSMAPLVEAVKAVARR